MSSVQNFGVFISVAYHIPLSALLRLRYRKVGGRFYTWLITLPPPWQLRGSLFPQILHIKREAEADHDYGIPDTGRK